MNPLAHIINRQQVLHPRLINRHQQPATLPDSEISVPDLAGPLRRRHPHQRHQHLSRRLFSVSHRLQLLIGQPRDDTRILLQQCMHQPWDVPALEFREALPVFRGERRNPQSHRLLLRCLCVNYLTARRKPQTHLLLFRLLRQARKLLVCRKRPRHQPLRAVTIAHPGTEPLDGQPRPQVMDEPEQETLEGRQVPPLARHALIGQTHDPMDYPRVQQRQLPVLIHLHCYRRNDLMQLPPVYRMHTCQREVLERAVVQLTDCSRYVYQTCWANRPAAIREPRHHGGYVALDRLAGHLFGALPIHRATQFRMWLGDLSQTGRNVLALLRKLPQIQFSQPQRHSAGGNLHLRLRVRLRWRADDSPHAFIECLEVPFLRRLSLRRIRREHVLHGVPDHALDARMYVLAVQHTPALLIDH